MGRRWHARRRRPRKLPSPAPLLPLQPWSLSVLSRQNRDRLRTPRPAPHPPDRPDCGPWAPRMRRSPPLARGSIAAHPRSQPARLGASGHGYLLLEEASLDPRELCTALRSAVTAAGVVLHQHEPVLSAAPEAKQFSSPRNAARSTPMPSSTAVAPGPLRSTPLPPSFPQRARCWL